MVLTILGIGIIMFHLKALDWYLNEDIKIKEGYKLSKYYTNKLCITNTLIEIDTYLIYKILIYVVVNLNI